MLLRISGNWSLTAGCFVALLLSGCETLDAIKIDDRHRTVNASVIVRPEAMRFGQSGMSRGGIEIGYEHYRGQDGQDVAYDHYLQVGQDRLDGPLRVSTAADIRRKRIAYNHLFKFGRHFELEPALGVWHDKLTFTVQENTPGARELLIKDDYFGLALAVTPRWNFNRYLGIETRIGFGIDSDAGTTMSDAITLVVRPIAQVALKAGYYWREQQFDRPTGQSNLNADFSGANAGIVLMF